MIQKVSLKSKNLTLFILLWNIYILDFEFILIINFRKRKNCENNKSGSGILQKNSPVDVWFLFNLIFDHSENVQIALFSSILFISNPAKHHMIDNIINIHTCINKTNNSVK